MIGKVKTYFYESWIQITGEGWTRKQVAVGYVFSFLFGIAVALYGRYVGPGWSGLQMIAIGLLAWDLCGGVIAYNHPAIKKRQLMEENNLHYYHHNLQHIHPLILIFFNHPLMLTIVTIYWAITFMIYVELLEISPKTGLRKIEGKGEAVVVGVEIVVAILLIALSFTLPNVDAHVRLFGVLIYGVLPFLTFILIRIPLSFQRTSSIMMVAAMVIVGMYVGVPNGFEWLIPIYYLKLLTGFTAKENV
jgi:hypothetical protein